MLLSSFSTQKFTTNIAKSSLLKQSFSNALTCYYPLARGIKDNPSVDEGKYNREAQTKASYSASCGEFYGVQWTCVLGNLDPGW